MRIKSILVLLLLISFVKVSLAISSEDLKNLKEIARAIKAHRKMIKTGKGDVSSYRKDFRTGRTAERHGKWWFKNDVWRFDYEDFQWSVVRTADGRLKEKTIREAELKDGILLDFIADDGVGYIVENHIPGIQGLYLMGITAVTWHKDEFDNYLKRIEKGLINNLQVKENVEFEGKRCVLIELNYPIDVGHTYEQIWISPQQQYSLIHYKSWLVIKKTGRPGNGAINDIKMEYIDPPGIWFPREATFKTYLSFPQKLIEEEKYIFSNTRLNIPITDEEVAVKLPPGARISNMINQEVYYLEEEATLEEILSGKVKSEREKRLVPLSERASTRTLWQQVRRNTLLEILIFILLFSIILIVLRKVLRAFLLRR